MLYYQTSSKLVKNMIQHHGIENFEWEVRRTFDDVNTTGLWENRVLRRCRVLENDIWLNANLASKKELTKAGAKIISKIHKDKPKSEEHKKNLSTSQKGKPKKSTVYQSEDYRRNMSKLKSGPGNAMYGKPCSEERAANISAAKKAQNLTAYNKDIPMTQAQKDKIAATKEKNKVMLTCEVCGKTMRQSNFKQYGHGPNCT